MDADFVKTVYDSVSPKVTFLAIGSRETYLWINLDFSLQ